MSGLFILLLFALALLLTVLTLMLAWEMRHPPRHTAGYAIARGMPSDPADLKLDFESWNLDRPDGAVLPVWDLATSNPKSTPPIQNPKLLPTTAVFIHGWGHGRVDSLARIQPFLPLFDRIVMYDLRGHGDSQYCLSRLGDDEHLDLLALLERLGDQRLVLIGHSMGAVIAIAAAVDATARHDRIAQRIAGIVAYGPYDDFHASLCGRLRVAGLPTRPITDLALMFHRLCGISPPNLRHLDLDRLRCPLLVIHGGLDRVAPIEHGRRITAAVGAATMIEIAGAGHIDAHLSDEALHQDAIEMFLGRSREVVTSTGSA